MPHTNFSMQDAGVLLFLLLLDGTPPISHPVSDSNHISDLSAQSIDYPLSNQMDFTRQLELLQADYENALKEVLDLRHRMAEKDLQLASAVRQYNDLMHVAMQYRDEAARWRDAYIYRR